MTASREAVLPLAITRSGEDSACVGALRQDGTWVRPEPIAPSLVSGSTPLFRYWSYTELELHPSAAPDARIEDRAFDAQSPLVSDACVAAADRLPLLVRHADPDVAAALGGARRSLGLVEVEVRRVYARRATGGRCFLRSEFCDRTGATFDWIIPELLFTSRFAAHVSGSSELDPGVAERLLKALRSARLFFTVGLTKPNHRFPGRFGGCHPLIVGIHSQPDYFAAYLNLARQP